MNILELTNWDLLSFTELDSILRLGCPEGESLVNKVLGNRLTPLCLACKHNREDLVTVLLYHGADPNKQSNFLSKAPLHYACDHEDGNIGVVRKLIQAKAEINTVDSDGNTGLHLACTESNIQVVKLLIESHADVNIRDIDGESPLVRACFAQNVDLISILLNAGGNPNVSDGQPLEIIVRNSLVDALKLLIDAGANIQQSSFLSLACEHDNIEMMKVLHQCGADVDKPNPLGMTPLQMACYHHNASLTTLKLLLCWGARVNACSESHKTALHYACIAHHLGKVHLLLAHGADVNVSDFHQLSPFMSAIKNPVPMNSESWPYTVNVIVELLIAAGSEVTADKLDRLWSAVLHRQADLIKKLFKDLRFYTTTPRTLQDLCRVQIRGVIPPNIDENIKDLPLPLPVIKYLKFSDVVSEFLKV